MKMKYRKGYKYQLALNASFDIPIYPGKDISTEFIHLNTLGNLVIFHGYSWDGASGPTYDDKHNMRGSLIHDALYQLMRNGLLSMEYRRTVDYVLYCTCLEDGMWKLRAKYYYWAVRKFAASAADPKSKKEVYDAP